MEPLSIRNAIRYGWETFKKRPWYLIGVMALLAIVNIALPNPDEQSSIPVTISAGLISFVIGTFLQLGGTNFTLKAHDNVSEARFADLWKPELFLKYLGVTLLTMVILGIAFLIPIAITFGLFLFIGWASLVALVLLVPGIILAIALSLAGYVAVDKSLGPIASVKESLRLTKGNRWKLFLLSLSFVGIAILGLVCLLVGILVALPVIAIAMAHAYRVIDAEKSSIVSA